MKHYKMITRVLYAAALAFAVQACTGNFVDINKNPYEPGKGDLAADGYIVGSSISGMINNVIPVKEHLNQFHEVLAGCNFAGYMASTPAWTAKFSTYNAPADWVRAPFNDVIASAYSYYGQIHANTDNEIVLAMAELLRVASMHRITDTYGPIPYSKVGSVGQNDGDGEGSLAAPYDSQEEVYRTMITSLDEIIATLTANRTAVPSFAGFDNVYSGDLTKWIRFANSLKLRMAVRLSYVLPEYARTVAESAVSHEVGVITSNADNAMLMVANNPYEMQIINWKDERAASDIVCFMNGYNDPRREVYFSKAELPGDTYYGLRNGTDVASKDGVLVYSIPMPNLRVNSPIMWMNAAEITFLRAEGALRGWAMNGDAKDLYEQAVRLSFSQHGVSGADAYLADNASNPASYTDPLGVSAYNYSSQTTIKICWNDNSGDVATEENLERIITQKWIAMFPLGIEAWSEFRRTGYPKLIPPYLNKSGGAVAEGQQIKRLPYPDTEYTENTANVNAAVSTMLGGPDNGGTKLWWDKKN